MKRMVTIEIEHEKLELLHTLIRCEVHQNLYFPADDYGGGYNHEQVVTDLNEIENSIWDQTVEDNELHVGQLDDE